MIKSYVTNCHIICREGEITFHQTNDVVLATLNGYTIIPNEQFDIIKNDADKYNTTKRNNIRKHG